MITKSEQQNIDQAGKRLLREVLETLGWVVNDVEEDYGIDSNVQIFEGKSPTGAWFHVQLKSSSSSAYSADSSFISQELEFDHARHYSLEMRQPVAVVHADVTAGKLYWYFPQLDRNLVQRCSETGRSITVRIPTCQLLPDGAPDLLTGLDAVQLVLANRALSSAPLYCFAESLVHLPDQEKLARAFQEKNDVLRLNRIAEFYGQGRLHEARSRAEAVVGDPDSNVETKFWAEIQLEAIDYHETVHSGWPQSELPKVLLIHAKRLQKLTKHGPKSLKFYSLINRHAAQLEVLVQENSSLFMALQQHLARGDNPLMVLGLYARRSVLTKRIFEKYNRCVRLARYATNYRERFVLGRALTNVVKATARYLVTLRSEGNAASAEAFGRSTLQICKLAAWISTEIGDDNGVIMAILSALTTTHTEESDAFRWAEQTARSISNENARADALRSIERARARWKGEKVEGDYHGDAIWQIAQNIATGMGLDLSDANSVLVRELRIAARDNSPDRVLVNCEHLLAARGAMGPTAQFIDHVLGIGTAGGKVLHCTIHDYHVEGKDLDTAYAEFRRAHCDSCPDLKPRPKGWRYDENERELEREKYASLVDRFAGTTFGVRYVNQD